MEPRGDLHKSLEIVHLSVRLAEWPAVKRSGNMAAFLKFGYTPTETDFVDGTRVSDEGYSDLTFLQAVYALGIIGPCPDYDPVDLELKRQQQEAAAEWTEPRLED